MRFSEQLLTGFKPDHKYIRVERIGFIKRSSYGSDILRSRSDGLPVEFGAKTGWWHISLNVKGIGCQKIKHFRITLTKSLRKPVV